jgi:23S rRNA (pseudouridine1915-N3)-methyltransferase
MKIRLLWTASGADAGLAEAIERYLSRIRHFLPVEVIEISGRRGRQAGDDASIMRADSAALLAAVPPQGSVVVLDERGDSIDSLKFAKWLERLTIEQPHGVTFVMGGDVGLDEKVRRRADKVLSLSAMTLPHQVARLVLVEQIYRAFTLMRGITYHK